MASGSKSTITTATAAPGAETRGAIPARSKGIFGGNLLTLAIQALLSAILLFAISDWHSMYEEDQPAKTAQILSLAHNGNWLHFATTTDYYRKDLFSAYYLAAAFFHQLSGLTALESSNVFSILAGVVFLAVTPVLLRRAFNLPPWLSWIVLVSTPIFPTTFIYGNEAPLAITMTVLAALALTHDSMAARFAGAACYVIATYSRSDYFLLWPTLSLLLLARKAGGIDWRVSIRKVLEFAAWSAVLGLFYFFFVLRKLPHDDYHLDRVPLKITAAFIAYSPNLVNTVFALIGLGICLWKKQIRYLALLLAGLQAVPSILYLHSPKYILPCILVMDVFALVAMLPLLRRMPVALALLLLLPWVVSVSPYGIFGPARSAFWYVPTDHGPLPTGGFLGFYPRVKRGFYEKRYDDELAQVGDVMPLIENQNGHADLVGYLDIGTIRLWAVRHGHWDWPTDHFPFWHNELDDTGGPKAHYITRMSYLYEFQETPALRSQLQECFKEGRVQAIADGTGPLPEIIQCGAPLPVGTDRELGARILFLNGYSQGNHMVERDAFYPDLSGVSWISREQFEAEKLQSKPLYMDSHWVCLTGDAPKAFYYSARYPLVYARNR